MADACGQSPNKNTEDYYNEALDRVISLEKRKDRQEYELSNTLGNLENARAHLRKMSGLLLVSQSPEPQTPTPSEGEDSTETGDAVFNPAIGTKPLPTDFGSWKIGSKPVGPDISFSNGSAEQTE